VGRDRETRGRAASAGIVSSLRSELASGRALTYQELAGAAKCTERTVRNYLDDARVVLGFDVERVRGSDHAIRVRRAGPPEAAPSIDKLARMLAREILRNVFPIAGTQLDSARSDSVVPIVVSIRGAYEYNERHLRTLRRWLQVASATPRRALQFRYDAAESGSGERVVWPVGMVLRDVARVYLAGVPAESTDGRDVRTYALEWIVQTENCPALTVLDQAHSGPQPHRLDEARIEEAIDAPFSMFRPSPDRSVRVRVRFDAREARYVVGRRWHRRQRITRTKDGGVIVEFGPADRHEVEVWLRGWGDGAKLLSMKAMRRRVGSEVTSRRPR
jgi:predicted DNA-binding transcriptional regulator YafY